jgi:transketolase
MLQYALIHLFGYKVTIDDLKAFRVSSIHLSPVY